MFPPVAAQPGNSPGDTVQQVKQVRLACSRICTSAAAALTAVVQAASGFAHQLSTAHEGSCPWRGARCDVGLGAFPALPAAAMLRAWQAALQQLLQLSCLPPLATQELQTILSSHRCAAQSAGQGMRTRQADQIRGAGSSSSACLRLTLTSWLSCTCPLGLLAARDLAQQPLTCHRTLPHCRICSAKAQQVLPWHCACGLA